MSSLLTDWREAVMNQLAEQLQGGTFDVRHGQRDGAVRDRKLAVVFVPALRADADVNWARPQLMVRAWLPKPRQPNPDSPQDPGPVEQLMWDLAECLRAVQVLPDIGGGRGLYSVLTEVLPEWNDWGVQATLIGWTTNPATLSPLG